MARHLTGLAVHGTPVTDCYPGPVHVPVVPQGQDGESVQHQPDLGVKEAGHT